MCNLLRTGLTASWHRMPATPPIASAAPGPTYREAGVIEARPAMVPDTSPTGEARSNLRRSHAPQNREPAAADRCVTAIAIAACPFAASAKPPLNPNQPTQSIAAPIITRPG